MRVVDGLIVPCELFSASGHSRGVFPVKYKRGRLYALICSRWCRVSHDDCGLLVEIF